MNPVTRYAGMHSQATALAFDLWHWAPYWPRSQRRPDIQVHSVDLSADQPVSAVQPGCQLLLPGHRPLAGLTLLGGDHGTYVALLKQGEPIVLYQSPCNPGASLAADDPAAVPDTMDHNCGATIVRAGAQWHEGKRVCCLCMHHP
jgi:hypothetical protein